MADLAAVRQRQRQPLGRNEAGGGVLEPRLCAQKGWSWSCRGEACDGLGAGQPPRGEQHRGSKEGAWRLPLGRFATSLVPCILSGGET
jgi:hypothetical protein